MQQQRTKMLPGEKHRRRKEVLLPPFQLQVMNVPLPPFQLQVLKGAVGVPDQVITFGEQGIARKRLERSQDRDGFVDMGSLAEQIRMFAQTMADQDDGMFEKTVADHAGSETLHR